MLAENGRWPHAQEVGRHIADNDPVGINIAVLLEEGVQCLQLSEGFRDAEVGAVRSERTFSRAVCVSAEGTHSSSVGRASHSVPPRNNVLTMKMAAIFSVAVKRIRLFVGPPVWSCHTGARRHAKGAMCLQRATACRAPSPASMLIYCPANFDAGRSSRKGKVGEGESELGVGGWRGQSGVAREKYGYSEKALGPLAPVRPLPSLIS